MFTAHPIQVSLLLLLAVGAMAQSAPYNGAPATLPGFIAIENFDEGGPDVAYSIWGESGRNGNFQEYRPEEKVSLDQQAGKVQVGWFHGSSWIKYSYSAAQSGSYSLYLTYRCGSWDEPRRLSFDFGQASAPGVDFPFNFNDMDWNSNLGGETALVTQGLELQAGTGVLTIRNSGNSDINLVAVELQLDAVGVRKPSPGGTQRRGLSPAVGATRKWFAVPGSGSGSPLADVSGRLMRPGADRSPVP